MWGAEDWVDGTRPVEGKGRSAVEWKSTSQRHKQRVRDVFKKFRRHGQTCGVHNIAMIFLLYRLSAGRPIGGSTNTLLGASNECFYQLLGFYFDQKRDTPPSNEPNNEPTIGRSKAPLMVYTILCRWCILALPDFGHMLSVGTICLEDRVGQWEVGWCNSLGDSAWRLLQLAVEKRQVGHLSGFLHKLT